MTAINLEQVRIRIREFIQQRLADYGGNPEFDDRDSLLLSGRLDSLAVLYLIMFLEQEFELDFSLFEFDPDRFDTIDTIVLVVEELGR